MAKRAKRYTRRGPLALGEDPEMEKHKMLLWLPEYLYRTLRAALILHRNESPQDWIIRKAKDELREVGLEAKLRPLPED